MNPSSSADQRSVRMPKKDGVMSHSVSTDNLSHYVDSLRAHGEKFQFLRARKLSTKCKGNTKSSATHAINSAGSKATLFGHLYDENGRRWWKVKRKQCTIMVSETK